MQVHTCKVYGGAFAFEFDEEITDDEVIVYPSDCPTDSDDDTL